VELAGRPLCDVPAGSSALVLSVAEDDQRILGYLGELGLRPGARAVVVESAPFQGPLTVEVEGVRTALAREVARLVTVEQLGEFV
jgi:DtxR family Mn-dependent transcriptional regulator